MPDILIVFVNGRLTLIPKQAIHRYWETPHD